MRNVPTWVFIVIGLLLLGGGGVAVYELTRGLRNKNPGNIKELPGDRTQWVGERATDDDPIFEEFNSMEDGIRAAAIIFRNYQSRYGLYTIEEMISRWAPGSENDTRAYIKFLTEYVYPTADWQIASRQPIDLRSAIIVPFLRGVFRMENGPLADTFISDDELARGIARA